MLLFRRLPMSLMLCLLISGVTFISPHSSALANEMSAQKADKLRKLFTVLEVDETVQEWIPLLQQEATSMLKDNLPSAPQQDINVLAGEFTKVLGENIGVFYELMIPQFDSFLSEQAIDDTIAFYQTPSGQEWVKANVHLMTVAEKVAEQWLQLVSPKAMAAISNKARELGYESF
ncbi:DUF2059 domain-containing protein [Thalassospira sp. MA62]|nr:DUF2059 domain-containing protein [Thalassospira sp. MA62]